MKIEKNKVMGLSNINMHRGVSLILTYTTFHIQRGVVYVVLLANLVHTLVRQPKVEWVSWDAHHHTAFTPTATIEGQLSR